MMIRRIRRSYSERAYSKECIEVRLTYEDAEFLATELSTHKDGFMRDLVGGLYHQLDAIDIERGDDDGT